MPGQHGKRLRGSERTVSEVTYSQPRLVARERSSRSSTGMFERCYKIMVSELRELNFTLQVDQSKASNKVSAISWEETPHMCCSVCLSQACQDRKESNTEAVLRAPRSDLISLSGGI